MINKYELTQEEVESRNKALACTAIYVLIIFALMLTGCVSLREGEAVAVDSTVLGMDLSVPVPGAEGAVNIINLKFGYIDTRVSHSYKKDVEITSEHKDIELLKGKGSVKRKLVIGTAKDGQD